MRTLFLGLGGLLVACGGLTEEDFSKQVGGMICDLHHECESAEEIVVAESFFGADVAACKALVDAAEEHEDTAGGDETENCEFDSDKGQACLDAMAELTCDSFAGLLEGCTDVCVDE